jgi:hypothetical protein
MRPAGRQHQQEPDTTNAIVVHVPLTIRRRGGRKLVISPAGAAQEELDLGSLQDAAGLAGPGSVGLTSHAVDDKLRQTLVRAFRWKQKLENGAYTTISDLAAAERLDTSFVSRTLRLTLLSPDLVEAILDGRQSDAAQRQTLLHKMPDEWCQQAT